jgi:hypothetical protein
MFGGEWLMRGRSGARAEPLARLGPLRSGPRRGISIAGTLLGGMAGFLLGAAFWIVLGVKELSSGDAAWKALPWEPACTALTLDRHAGHTTAGPCFAHALPPRAGPGRGLERTWP